MAMWGWYFFAFVPPKLEYFLGLRYRTLAVAAGQFKSKVESLSAAEDTARQQTFGEAPYLEFLIPELRADPKPVTGLDLGSRRIAWEDVVGQAAAASQRDFDDLLLADAQGRILWQRERTSPRVGSLPELLEAPSGADGWSLSFQWSIQTTPLKVASGPRNMPETATSRIVNLDGTASLLIVQPMTFGDRFQKQDRRFFLAGLVSRSALRDEAMHIPTEWVVLAMLPFVLVFLALPLVKLATVTPRERYAFVDVVALGLATVVAAAIGGAFPFMSAPRASEDDDSLQSFAEAIRGNVKAEASLFLGLTDAIKAHRSEIGNLARCEVPIKDTTGRPTQALCDFWGIVPKIAGTSVVPGFSELDVVAWVDRNGQQIEKWTTKRQITALVPQNYQHFRDVLAHRTWTFDGETPDPFTIEPMRSPTTSEMAFVFAVPTDTADHPATPDQSAPPCTARTRNPCRPPDSVMLALNVKPQSLVDPLVPPGYGFAVLAADGRVLFHSRSELSLEENFLREIGDPGIVARTMRTGESASWTGDYHGRQHRFYAGPLGAFLNCPWHVVTFRELDSVLAFTAARQSGAVALFGLNVVALSILLGLGGLVQRIRGQRLMDSVMSASIQSRRPGVVLGSTICLAILAALAAGILAATYSAHPRYLTGVWLFFLILPMAAVLVVVCSRKLGATSSAHVVPSTDRQYGLLASEIFLVGLLVGALPAAGLSRIVHRVDEAQRTIQTLNQFQREARAREDRIRGAVFATRNYSEDTKHAILDMGFAAEAKTASFHPPVLYSYLHALHKIDAEPDPGQDSFEPYSPSLVERLLARMGGLTISSANESVRAEFSWISRRYRLNGADEGADYNAGAPSQLLSWPGLAGLLILTSVFAGVLWARERLSTRGAPRSGTLSLLDAVRTIEANGADPAVLLIGPPRAQRDSLVTSTIEDVTGHPPALRIQLLDAELAPAWVDQRLKEIETLKAAARSSSPTIWIHISNLEAQLVHMTSRTQVLRLIDKLLVRRDGDPRIALVVTSTIDPISHFSEVFVEERNEIYANMVPEVELNRSTLVLSRFRRCFLRLAGDTPWESWLRYKPCEWQATLRKETSCHPLLADIGPDLERAWAGRTEVRLEELRDAVGVRAEAAYQLLWTSCTRSEKLVLVHLAQEGLVNPKSRDTVDELLAKGLITPGPPPALFNFTVREFLKRIERADVLLEWERMEGSGLWVISGKLAASVLMIGGVFYLLTQGFAVQSVLPILSGSGFLGAPILKELVARIPSRSGARAT